MQILKKKAGTALFSSFLLLIIFIVGCTTDKDIKAQITEMAKSDVNFAGVEYAVEGKTVTLTGRCPSKKAKDAVEQTLKSIKVINGIRNDINIAPVILDSSFATKLEVDSVLIAYPSVTADVRQGIVILKGTIKKQEVAPLLAGIKKLNLHNVENQLSTDQQAVVNN